MNEMNEQEKKTFRFLKDVYNLNFRMCSMENADIKNIINIIEKLQKEIENLKAITKEYEAYNCREDNKIIASKEWFADGYFKNFLSDYISKDKIRKLIKEKAKTDTYNFKTIAVKDIEELLEE